MNIFGKIAAGASSVRTTILRIPLIFRIIFLCVVFVAAGGGTWWFMTHRKPAVKYVTAKITKGTLTTSITGTGTITTGNSTNITTGATGTVKEVFVSNGTVVEKGQKIAELTLDEYGLEHQAAMWLKYTTALNAVKTAQKNKTDADLAMWKSRQAILDAEDNVKYYKENPVNPKTNENYTVGEKTVIDKALVSAKSAFSEAEAKYQNADAEISNANASVTAAWRDYQEVSSTIIAPSAGTIAGLTLAPGVVIASTSTTTSTTNSTTTSDSSNTVTSQKIGKVNSTDGQFQATVNLAESDVVNVNANQKVTLTLDAYSDKTFTGKVLAVDTSGSVSSGVTSYPVTILLDSTNTNIYPNMAVSATIITDVKTDVLSILSTAIQTSNGSSSVLVMKNGKPSTVAVTTGISNDTQTEITSGLSAGDEVVTDMSTTTATTTDNTSSPFSSTSKTKTSSTKTGTGGMGGMGGGMGGPPGF